MDETFPGSTGRVHTYKTIYQDNKSTILITENGRASSSKPTRHLNVRYYFITDQIKKDMCSVPHMR